MKRRAFLQQVGAASLLVAARSVVGFSVALPALTRAAQGATGLPLVSLQNALHPSEALLLLPDHADYKKYLTSFNLRTQERPEVRVLCRTAEAVATTVAWARNNKVPFAVRGGGHSYEGFSQSPSVVIDGRLMADVEWEGGNILVGAGARLGDVYQTVGAKGYAIPAGSCPTVGVAGHTQGGGFGLLGRPFGLACDSLLSMEVVDAQGRILKASHTENPDLFWALRGGGGGSFGLVTKFEFKPHRVRQVVTFGVSWVLPARKAVKVMAAWQNWIQGAPAEITSIFRSGKDKSGNIALRCAGQSVGNEQTLRAELKKICVEKPTSLSTEPRSFLEAVSHFGGKKTGDVSIYMKGKSDFVYQPLNEQGMMAIMTGLQKLPAGAVSVIFDGYGGAVSRVAPDETAFFHRKALYQVQYYSQWSYPEETAKRVQMSRAFHDSLRPYMSGYAYVNYCDLDVKNYAEAYWGDNLARLKQVKNAYDPENIFRHAQSVPL